MTNRDLYGRIRYQINQGEATMLYNRGQLVPLWMVQKIAESYVLSKHAEERYNERFPNMDIKEAILHNEISYFNTDGTINICFNKFEYVVVNALGKNRNHPKVITFKETSHNFITVYDKRELAMKGIARRDA